MFKISKQQNTLYKKISNAWRFNNMVLNNQWIAEEIKEDVNYFVMLKNSVIHEETP